MNQPSRTDEAAALRRAEKTLLERLRKTQAEVRRVDLFSAICAFATFGLGVLFVGILFDHWILPDGFSARGRVVFCVGWLVSTTIFFAFRLVPALRRRVNPLFAAQTLEIGWQDAHNSAINWLQLRRRKDENGQNGETASPLTPDAPSDSPSEPDFDALQAAMLRGVALQAAQKARSAPNETAVDCAPLIRWGIAFAVVVAVCALYSVFSPKNPFASAGRLAAPLASIERPQAIRFAKIVPGDVAVFQGDFIDVDAEIPGVGALPVAISYSTEDGRLTDLELPMNALGASRFQAKFPDSEAGFEENLTYRVVVGRGSRFESRSPVYLVDVRARPSLRVEKTTLNFPDYTGLAPQTFENQGDVRALEGTVVELVARSNVPLKSAFFLPDGDETRAKTMKIASDNPNIATFSFKLDWKSNADGEKTPEFSSFRLRSEDENGERNRDENLYSVETLPDQPPTIRWEATPDDAAEIPLNDVFRARVEAEDPDFGLRAVRLRTAIRDLNEGANAGRPNPTPLELLPNAASPVVGARVLSGKFVPEKLGLKIGDEIEYWAEAVDAKTPEANVAATEKRLFVVGAPVANPSSPDDEPENPQNPEDSPEDAQDKQNGEGGQGGESSQENGQNGADQSEQNDGETSKDAQNGAGKSGNSGETDPQNADSNPENSENGESSPDKNGSGSDENAPSKPQNQRQNQQNRQNPSKNGESGGGEETSGGAENENSPSNEESSGANGGENSSGDGANGCSGASGSNENSDSSGQNENSGANASGGAESEPSSNDENASATNDGGASGSTSPAPIDPETNPGDAFEKMLDYINRENAQNAPQNGGGPASESDSNGGAGSASNDSADSNGSDENSENDENAQNPGQNADSDREPTDETPQKRDFPTRTSGEKPGPDAERFQANDADADFDPTTADREKGDVDPDSNRFFAQNANPNDARPPKTADQNAKINRDPLDDSPETPGDAPNPNAQEARGNSANSKNSGNSGQNGPFEVEREGENADGEPPADSGDAPPLDPAELPPDAALGGGSSNGNADAPNGDKNQNRPPKSNGSGARGDRSQNADSNEKRDPTAGGGSESPSGARGGGGGGSGLGELGGGPETLAPADAPTLQYAEQATNLVLERLENDLKNRVDRRLLDELGWTEAELREFLERWRKMRADAENDADPDAKNRYLQALENVGLTPDADATAVDVTLGRREKDERPRSVETARESARTKTPNALEERVRAFRRGISGSGR